MSRWAGDERGVMTAKWRRLFFAVTFTGFYPAAAHPGSSRQLQSKASGNLKSVAVNATSFRLSDDWGQESRLAAIREESEIRVVGCCVPAEDFLKAS